MTNTVAKWRYIVVLGFYILIGFGLYLTENMFNFQMLEQKYLNSIKPAYWTRVAFFVLAAIILWMVLIRKKRINKGFFLLVLAMSLLTANLSFRSLTVNKMIGEITEHWTVFKVRTIYLKELDIQGYCYETAPLTLNLYPLKSDEKIKIFRGIWPFNYNPKDIVNAMKPWTPCLKGLLEP